MVASAYVVSETVEVLIPTCSGPPGTPQEGLLDTQRVAATKTTHTKHASDPERGLSSRRHSKPTMKLEARKLITSRAHPYKAERSPIRCPRAEAPDQSRVTLSTPADSLRARPGRRHLPQPQRSTRTPLTCCCDVGCRRGVRNPRQARQVPLLRRRQLRNR